MHEAGLCNKCGLSPMYHIHGVLVRSSIRALMQKNGRRCTVHLGSPRVAFRPSQQGIDQGRLAHAGVANESDVEVPVHQAHPLAAPSSSVVVVRHGPLEKMSTTPARVTSVSSVSWLWVPYAVCSSENAPTPKDVMAYSPPARSPKEGARALLLLLLQGAQDRMVETSFWILTDESSSLTSPPHTLC
jgi:hypothetical protein